MNKSPRAGVALLVLVVAALGFMMSISTSYITIEQTETEAITAISDKKRSFDAAFAGISLYLAHLHQKEELFDANSSGNLSDRNFLYFSNSSSSVIAKPGVPTSSMPSDAIKKSNDWINYKGNMEELISDSSDSSDIGEPGETIKFRVVSYPSRETSETNEIIYVKSKGEFAVYDGEELTGEIYQTQLLAKIKVDKVDKYAKLITYQEMKFESDSDFGTIYKAMKN
jgi:hypothetical protein